MTSIRGIDIASYQGAPDFAAVRAAGFDFVVDKITQGTSYVNPRFAQTWPAITAAGMLRAVYHYAEPDANTPEDEAAWFLQNGQPALEPGDVLALDVEEGAGNLSDWVIRWFAAVSAALGANPWLYTNLDYLQNHGLAIPAIATVNGLWLASYRAALPDPPAPWDFVACWQQSATGHVPGIAGNVDLDVFEGSHDQFIAYGVPAVAPPPSDPCADLRQQVLNLQANLSTVQNEMAESGALAARYHATLADLGSRIQAVLQ